MFPMACKVCPLFLCDKSDCGRPQHAGVWLSAHDEEHFVELWREGERNHFSMRHAKFFSHLPSENQIRHWTADTILKSVSLISMQCREASQGSSRAVALCLMLSS